MDGCTNGDRVESGMYGRWHCVVFAILRDRDPPVLSEKEKSFRFGKKFDDSTFLLHFLHKEGPWGCAPKGTYYLVILEELVELYIS